MRVDGCSPDEILRQQGRAGLRIAFAVAVGMTVGAAHGAALPFLGPLFAAQFLLSSREPLPLGKAIGTIGVVLVVGQASILMSSLFSHRPGQFLLLLSLFYFVCFYLQAQQKGGPAVFLCIIVGTMVPLLDRVHDRLDSGVLSILLGGVISGTILSWLAHAAFPNKGGGDEKCVAAAEMGGNPAALAAVNTIILLGAVTLCLTDTNFALALVIPITVASLLGQITLASSVRLAVGLVALNLLGGLLGSLGFIFVESRPTLLNLFLTTLLAGLLLGGPAAAGARLAPVYGGALITFLILFGTGVSPLPSETPDSFSTRIGYVLLAIAYTLLASSLLCFTNTRSTSPK